MNALVEPDIIKALYRASQAGVATPLIPLLWGALHVSKAAWSVWGGRWSDRVGARTAIIALALYSFLPVIRNTVTGILGVDAKVREAAVAMGMTDWQILKMVELPLAMPVILTGIRVAVVIAVGVATVAFALLVGYCLALTLQVFESASAPEDQPGAASP